MVHLDGFGGPTLCVSIPQYEYSHLPMFAVQLAAVCRVLSPVLVEKCPAVHLHELCAAAQRLTHAHCVTVRLCSRIAVAPTSQEI